MALPPWAFPVERVSSGVSEFFREPVEVRGRFWPAFGRGPALGAGGAAFCDFFGGASGAGHSTSCVRSMREAGMISIMINSWNLEM